jgi:hypothetical protein
VLLGPRSPEHRVVDLVLAVELDQVDQPEIADPKLLTVCIPVGDLLGSAMTFGPPEGLLRTSRIDQDDPLLAERTRRVPPIDSVLEEEIGCVAHVRVVNDDSTGPDGERTPRDGVICTSPRCRDA